MPKYTFTGDLPAILAGLTQGVNAEHVAAPGNSEVPEGTTVVASPGDKVDTGDLEYIAAFLEEDPAPAPKTHKKPESTDKTSKES